MCTLLEVINLIFIHASGANKLIAALMSFARSTSLQAFSKLTLFNLLHCALFPDLFELQLVLLVECDFAGDDVLDLLIDIRDSIEEVINLCSVRDRTLFLLLFPNFVNLILHFFNVDGRHFSVFNSLVIHVFV